ncbi:hypothetical protein THIOSC13_500065 [uncultured Thiomicrorhabdus sp.]
MIVVHVITSQGERTVGLVVDAVSDVQTFDMDNLQPPPDISTEVSSQFIIGLANLGSDEVKNAQDSAGRSLQSSTSGMVVLVDIDRLVNESLIEQISATDMPVGNG